MAHTFCPNGHFMWNGDGKPRVWAFRVGFIRDFIKEHPGCILDYNEDYWQLYDCVEGVPGENLECWYCDECKGLAVFVDKCRYDYKWIDILPNFEMDEFSDWEDYIALRDSDFEDFQEFYEGKSPIDAIEQYDFTYRYKLSPDREKLYAFDREGRIAFGFYKSKYYDFTKDTDGEIEWSPDSVGAEQALDHDAVETDQPLDNNEADQAHDSVEANQPPDNNGVAQTIVKVKNTSYSRYEELILRRDSLRKEGYQLEIEYSRVFGELLIAVFKEQVKCVQKKKAIEFCHASINHGKTADQKELQSFVEKETQKLRDNQRYKAER